MYWSLHASMHAVHVATHYTWSKFYKKLTTHNQTKFLFRPESMKGNQFLCKFRNLSIICYHTLHNMWGSHSGAAEDSSLLRCCNMYITTQIQNLHSSLLSRFSGLSNNPLSFLLRRKTHVTFQLPTPHFLYTSHRLLTAFDLGLPWGWKHPKRFYPLTNLHGVISRKTERYTHYFCMALRELSGENSSGWNGPVAGTGTGLRMLQLQVLSPESSSCFGSTKFPVIRWLPDTLKCKNTSLCKPPVTHYETLKLSLSINDNLAHGYLKPKNKC